MGRLIKDWPAIVGATMCFAVVLIVAGGVVKMLVEAMAKAIASIFGLGL